MKILGMGLPELLIILAVILLIFGPKNLPKLGASVGKTVKSLREGLGGGEKLVEADDEEEAVEEIVEEAAKREVLEETGLTVHSLKLFGVYSGPDLYHVYPDGNEAYIIDIVYSSDDFSGVIKRQESEVNDLRWFSMAELPENLSPPIRRALHDFIAAQNKQS